MKHSFALLVGVGLSISNLALAETFEGKPRVVDGDTLKLGAVTVRLDAIDAPEAGQTCSKLGGGEWSCGEAAMNRLVDLVADGVVCESDKMDLYRRYLGVCVNSDGININQALVEEGFAWAFRRYSTAYAKAEDDAHERGVGVWQAPTMAPWDYRHRSWTVAVSETSTPKDCPIKGNINTKGERIYHMPWSPWYAKTKIDISKGERWFCDEGEAVAAGWRAAAWR